MLSRKSINSFIKKYGYEIIKIDKLKEIIENEYLRTGEDFKFLQIGANDGVKFDSLYYFVTSHNCSGVVVEPLSYYFEKLTKNYQNFPNIKPLKLAVHESDKQADLHYVDPEKLDKLPEWAEGIGSLDPSHHKKSNTPSEYMVSENVECTHLIDIIKDHDLFKLNYLQIDTEGYDYKILKMLDFKSVRPRIIKFENDHLSEQEQNDVATMLKNQGYELIKDRIDVIAYL